MHVTKIVDTHLRDELQMKWKNKTKYLKIAAVHKNQICISSTNKINLNNIGNLAKSYVQWLGSMYDAKLNSLTQNFPDKNGKFL